MTASAARIDLGHGWSATVGDASIDHLENGGRQFLRSVRVIVRDHDWCTVPVSSQSVAVDEGVTVITAELDGLGVQAAVTARFEPADGGFRFSASIEARSDFDSNRAGIIVLHSPDQAGLPFTIVHPDGSETETAFPVAIAPHQPAKDIAALVVPGGRLDFAGDVFEMEDQRNWTDASFKTYSTPLSLPFPVRIAAGTVISQSVTATLSSGFASASAEAPAVRPIRSAGTAPAAFPRIAVGASTAPGRPARPLPWLAGARADAFVELDLASPGWSRALARARADAPGAALDVRLIASRPDDLDAAAHALCGVPVTRLAVYDSTTHGTTPELWERLVALAESEPLTGTLIGGTRAHFTELNRTWHTWPDGLGGVTFSVTPGMHDWSTLQKVESIAQQRLVALQAVETAAGAPVHVGPITLRARFNAVATSPRPVATGDLDHDGYGAELTWGSTDPLQDERFAAAWLVASVAALAVDGVASITLGEAWGPRGFGTAAGEPFPAAAALARLVALQGQPVVFAGETAPSVWAIAVRRAASTEIVAANLADEMAVVEIAGARMTLAPHGVEDGVV